jgi:BolA family transcriptional regulator, general stress-responsive regulator
MREIIESRIKSKITVQKLELNDYTEAHAGHQGMLKPGAHLNLILVSKDFAGQSRLARHRMVMSLLQDMLDSGEIHALSMELKTPEEN